MADQYSLIRSVEAEPSNPAHRRIYADWLDEDGQMAAAKEQRVAADAVELAISDMLSKEALEIVREATARLVPGSFGIPVRFESGRFQVGNLEIVATDRVPNSATILLDGQELHGVRGILIEGTVSEEWRVELDLVPARLRLSPPE